MFSKITLYCIACGKKHTTDQQKYKGLVCSEACHTIYQNKKIISMLGQDENTEKNKMFIETWKDS